jgi:hypothetical protein
MKPEDKLRELSEALAEEGCDRAKIQEWEAERIVEINKLRKQRDRDIRDMQIAQLIPEGPDAVIERFGGARRTAFWRASRGRKLLKTVQRSA